MERGVLGSQAAIPVDGHLVELPSHSFAVLNILECSFVNYIMSHPLLHSAISSSPVIAGCGYGLRDTNLPRARLNTSGRLFVQVCGEAWRRAKADHVLLCERDNLADLSAGLKAGKLGTVLATTDRVCGRKEQK